MGRVTSFDVTVSDNLETCFQVRNGPFNTTRWHTQECIHRPHLLEPASTGLFVQQAKEKIKIGNGVSFMPIPPPGQPDLATLFAYYCFLQLLGTFVVWLVSQLLLYSLPLDLVSTRHLNKFGHKFGHKFMVQLVSQLLLHSLPLDLVSTKHLNKFGHIPMHRRP